MSLEQQQEMKKMEMMSESFNQRARAPNANPAQRSTDEKEVTKEEKQYETGQAILSGTDLNVKE